MPQLATLGVLVVEIAAPYLFLAPAPRSMSVATYPPLGAPRAPHIGPCASSGRAWLLERAASEAANVSAFD